jgi:hypothetical protein
MEARVTGTFSVKNFETFQHYNDRTPPWIKLYNRLLDNYDFGLLPDASKAHLIAIWLLASRSKNVLPIDPAWIAKRISATTPVDLNILRNADFIVFNQACSEVLAGCKQDACPEREIEKQVQIERITSEVPSDPSKPEPQPVKSRTSYPEAFEAFWREYPTDALMSKKAAFAQWQRLDQTSREAATAAIPAFKAHCRKNPTYRPVHAQRFLSERRFDGFEKQQALSPAEVEAALDRRDRLLKQGKYDPQFGQRISA